MSENAISSLYKDGDGYLLDFPEHSLQIKGPFLEWVFEAATDIITKIEKTKAEGTLDELELLSQFDDEDHSVEIDSLKYENKTRFEVVPQCLVSIKKSDYRWVAPVEGENKTRTFGERLFDMSLTRSNSWLTDQDAA